MSLAIPLPKLQGFPIEVLRAAERARYLAEHGDMRQAFRVAQRECFFIGNALLN
jgi:hypothetical protein